MGRLRPAFPLARRGRVGVRSAPMRDGGATRGWKARGWALVVVGVLIALAAASPASAQSGDVVMLANGGRLRGTVEVYEPGADLVIVLPDGTRRTVPAADVAQVIFGDAAGLAAPPPPAAPPPTTPPVETAPPTLPPDPATAPAIIAPLPAPPAPGPAPMVIPPSAGPAPGAPPRGYGAPGDAPSGEGFGLPDVQHLEAMGSDSAGIPEGAVREYSPGADASSEWSEDVARQGLPLGMFHLGVELRGMARMGGSVQSGTQVHGGVELGMNFILRLAPWFHLRGATFLGVHTGEDFRYEDRFDCRSPWGSWGSCTWNRGGTGLGTFGVRVLLALDASRLFSLRVGGQFGGEWIAQYAMATFYGAPELDIVGQLTDEGRLEIGLGISVPFHQICRSEDPRSLGASCGESIALQIEILTGVIF